MFFILFTTLMLPVYEESNMGKNIKWMTKNYKLCNDILHFFCKKNPPKNPKHLKPISSNAVVLLKFPQKNTEKKHKGTVLI